MQAKGQWGSCPPYGENNMQKRIRSGSIILPSKTRNGIVVCPVQTRSNPMNQLILKENFNLLSASAFPRPHLHIINSACRYDSKMIPHKINTNTKSECFLAPHTRNSLCMYNYTACQTRSEAPTILRTEIQETMLTWDFGLVVRCQCRKHKEKEILLGSSAYKNSVGQQVKKPMFGGTFLLSITSKQSVWFTTNSIAKKNLQPHFSPKLHYDHMMAH